MVQLPTGLLEPHRQDQNGTSWGTQWEATHPPPPDPRLYKVYLPWTYGFQKCLVEICGGWVSTSTNLRIHFVQYHMQGKIVILEEGNDPHPCCPACGMFIPWVAMKNSNPTTAIYTQGDNRKQQWLSEEEEWAGSATVFRYYGKPLETTMYLKYSIRLIPATEMTGQKSSSTYRSRRRAGIACTVFWGGRERTPERQVASTGQWYRQSYDLERENGWRP